MCESTAYIVKNGKEEQLMENVDFLENQEGSVRIANLFGEEQVVKGRVKSLSLVDHKIILEAA
ncbi:MAG TPA: CooT family nickel-binding protein [Desulfobacteraceae bacterium]|nr:MAG: RNA-binding protein [Desulfobacteraceae bacterium 4484_190.3]RLB19660.1 MAG: RNA-binding protein [Deltaproteobacteria bacterium]HDZ23254.1 CooT family nickel-binding protein [Desulfobacteraceae bacterium]